ncbi:dihydroxyacetone kinase subunit DhaK [Allostreptomyces psammosilenae]|uniref:Dihydroxyacetone kinase-like protein n=1 Tax=Allostreptomyces psammosilenae TaxID=1892865 RepID=A0A853AAD9_9ACTN|nr:dihydroxyacetone kinase subunit DhaK [Allostreptomyces psammosilenae]NYI07478.1 dihydroxyacetone kinase-like protein [Allostreptomyces psammosilenae]
MDASDDTGATAPGAGTPEPPAPRRTKKLVNAPDEVVADALRGLAAAHPRLRVDPRARLVVRTDAPVAGKVGLVSGGGTGHEPLHSGFVGPGMLDAACPGAVFTSPVPHQMVEATRAVDGGAGVLHVVKNYTGDVLNFRMAAELAEEEGLSVRQVVVDDDVAVSDSTFTAGRRGTGATLFVEKIAGALAERRAPLDAVADVARRVNDASRSFGVALTACTTPERGVPTFELGPDEIEVGVGIHGEPGRERRALAPARELVETAVEAVLAELPDPVDGPVMALLNGMGGTPLLELYVAYGDLVEALELRGVPVVRSLVGNYVTSLDMAGFSVTLCRADEEMLRLWDAPVETAALRWGR